MSDEIKGRRHVNALDLEEEMHIFVGPAGFFEISDVSKPPIHGGVVYVSLVGFRYPLMISEGEDVLVQ